MNSIRPTVVAPLNSPDQATAYWRAVCTASAYNGTLAQLQSLYSLVGATSLSQLTFPAPLPAAVYVGDFGPAGVVVQIIGTTSPVQIAVQALGGLLAVVPGWTGPVGLFWSACVSLIRPALDAALLLILPPQVVYVGDSLGGAVAALFGSAARPYPTGGIWTQGQPRCGSTLWADSVTVPYERWTNYGDPMPVIPPCASPILDATLLPLWAPPALSWRHAGVRWAIGLDGTLTQRTESDSWIDGTEYLAAQIVAGSGWVAAHSSLAYACAIRRGIPVPWLTPDPAWPLLDAVDAVYTTLLATSGGVCPDLLNTQQAVINPSGPRWAVQGICG